MSKYQHTGRTEQTTAALKRYTDALRLQAQRRWRGAMYVAGYSVECKLKARLMEQYNLNTLEELEGEIARRLRRPVNVFTHNIEVLFGLTGARDRLLQSTTHPNALRAYQECNKWKPAWRYKPDDGTEDECNDFMEAVKEFRTYIASNV